MKTKNLERALPDYWVSRVMQTPINRGKRFEPVSRDHPKYCYPRDYPVGSGPSVVPGYSTDWGAAGPIIDHMSAGRNGICLTGSL
jgi:hypothetical protein